jgi:hypothetical protein
MSEQSGGPGWWVASDGKWYPPEQAPGVAPGAEAPAPGASASPASPASPAASQPSGNKGKVIAALVAAVALVVVGIIIVTTRDSGGSGGSVSAFCGKAKQLRSSAFSDTSDLSSDQLGELGLQRLEALDKVAPAEIKPDVDTLIEATKQILDISKGGDLSDLSDLDEDKLPKAGKNVEQFTKDKCGFALESDQSS